MRASTQGLTSAVLASGCLATCLTAIAQAPITPGQVGDTLKPPIQLQPARPAPAVQAPPQEAPPAAASSKTMIVQRFEFSGNTLFGSDELSAQIKDYLDRPVTLLEIFEAADKVADFYVSRGYTLASVNVPPQKIDQGSVRLLVSEGRIGNVVTENSKLYAPQQIRDQLGEIRPGTIYQGRSLEARLRHLNTLPGLQARATVKPGERYGTSDLVIKTVEDPISGALIVDNFGRESVGEIRFSAFAQLNNPLKVGDQLQLLALRSEDNLLTYGYAAYSLPINYTGTRLTLSYGEADFNVEGATPVEGGNRSTRLLIDHPAYTDGNSRLSFSAGVSHTSGNSDIAGGPAISGTSISLFEAGASYTYNHASLAVTQVVANVSTNFDDLKRQELDNAFLTGEDLRAGQRLRAEIDIQHVQPLVKSFQLFAHLNGVYSPDPLSDLTQFSLGGPNSIRGYPASEERGDRGYFGTLALSRPFALGGFRIAPRIFADAGRTMSVDPGLTSAGKHTLTSIGVGTDLQYDRINAKLDWAFPRDNHTASDNKDAQSEGRLFGSLAVSF
jgi:hemolysin activation/secretion protein